MDDANTKIMVNGKDFKDYFDTSQHFKTVMSVFDNLEEDNKYSVTVIVKGGGKNAQSEAVRHGIARAIVKNDEANRKVMKKLTFLKRDPRSKERKKFGLKKARKAPQWSKR